MRKYIKTLLLVAIFVSSFLLMTYSAKSESATTDESVHLFAGYTYLTQKDFRLDPEHPPLIKEIAALPLLFVKPNYYLGNDWQTAGNYYYDSWKEARTMGNEFMYSWGNNADQLLFLSRLMMIFMTLGLGLAVYFYAKKLYGDNAGIFAAFLTLFLPIVLAHGHLVNTDIGVTLFSLLTIYFWTGFLKSPSWKSNWWNLLFSGVFLGLALSSKYTAAIFVPVFIILALVKIIKQKKEWRPIVFGLIGVGIVAFIVIWSTYGFLPSAPPKADGGLASQINSWSTVNFTNKYDAAYESIRPFLVPRSFFKGLQLITRHVVGGNGAYLLGHNSISGWWYYFPIAIFFKTPIALFIFFGLACYYYRKTKTKLSFDEYALLISGLGFLIIAMLSRANLGVRHVLPFFPFMIIFASRSINLIDFNKLKWRIYSVIFLAALAWYAIIGFGSFPNYLAYFNEFAGGTSHGYKVLTDSNLDWGQDIYHIKNYMNANHISQTYIVYPWDGDLALDYNGIKFTPLTPDMQNVKGPVVISATYYDTDAYSWLRYLPKTEITPGVFFIKIE